MRCIDGGDGKETSPPSPGGKSGPNRLPLSLRCFLFYFSSFFLHYVILCPPRVRRFPIMCKPQRCSLKEILHPQREGTRLETRRVLSTSSHTAGHGVEFASPLAKKILELCSLKNMERKALCMGECGALHQ